MTDTFNADLIRRQFPLIANENVVYLDNAATTQKPQLVLDEVNRYYQQYNSNVHRGAHKLSDQATSAYEKARDRVARFINAYHREEIIWTSGATESINLVAQSYAAKHLKPGDEILVSLLEHHSNIVPWQQAAKETGATLHPIPITESGDIDLEAYERLLSPKTKLVAITQLSNALGTVTPIKQCIRLAKQVGALSFVDGAQGIVHLATDVQDIGCDFYAFSGHKLYAPTGIGVLWGRRELLEDISPWQFGGEMIEHVSFENTTFNRLPFKFEAGTPNIAGAIGLGSAIHFLSSLDRAKAADHEQRLFSMALQGLEQIPGINIIGLPQKRSAAISFTLDSYHTYDIATLLDQQQIAIRTGHHCTMPLMQHLGLKEGTARISLAIYNNEQDVSRLLQALEMFTDTKVYGAAEAAAENLSGSDKPIQQQLSNCRDWQSRYSYVMKLGKAGVENEQRLRVDANKLHGCTSQVWISHNHNSSTGRLVFELDSDAKVIRGLSRVLLEAIEGLTAKEICSCDLEAHFKALDLIQHLSVSRGNGIRAIIDEIRTVAESYNS